MNNPTVLQVAIKACGITPQEAAEYLETSPDAVAKALSGETATPPAWLEGLGDLNDQQTAIGARLECLWWEGGAQGDITLKIPSTDAEAREMGLPCVNAHYAVAAYLWSNIRPPLKSKMYSRGWR